MIYCSEFGECDETKRETVGAACRASLRVRERMQHLKGLEALTIEERLRCIEEYIYDHAHSYHAAEPLRY